MTKYKIVQEVDKFTSLYGVENKLVYKAYRLSEFLGVLISKDTGVWGYTKTQCEDKLIEKLDREKNAKKNLEITDPNVYYLEDL